jgi:hypothetical protein
MPNDWHRNPFEPRSGLDVRIAVADQNTDRRNVIDADVLLNGKSYFSARADERPLRQYAGGTFGKSKSSCCGRRRALQADQTASRGGGEAVISSIRS